MRQLVAAPAGVVQPGWAWVCVHTPASPVLPHGGSRGVHERSHALIAARFLPAFAETRTGRLIRLIREKLTSRP